MVEKKIISYSPAQEQCYTVDDEIKKIRKNDSRRVFRIFYRIDIICITLRSATYV